MLENFLTQTPENLMINLRQEILEKPAIALNLINKIEKTERFKVDFCFYCAVMVQKISALTFLGRYNEISSIINKVYKDSILSNNEEIYLEACARLGNAYYEIGDIEQAIMLFKNIYDYEKEHNSLSKKSSGACNNLGTIYFEYKKINEASIYYKKAYQIFIKTVDLKNITDDQLFLYIVVLTNLATVVAEANDLTRFYYFANKLKAIPKEKVPPVCTQIYSEVLLYEYHFTKQNEKLFKESITLLQTLFEQENYPSITNLLPKLYEFNNKNPFCEEKTMINIICEALDIIEEKAIYSKLRKLYIIILEYSIKTNDYELMNTYYNKIKNISLNFEKESDANRLQMINLYVELAKQKSTKSSILKQNQKLDKLNQESQIKNQELKNIHDKLRIISNIGQKINTTSTLFQLQESLNNELLALMPITSMALFVKIDDENYRAPYIYDNDSIKTDYLLNINDKFSITATVIKNGKPRFSNDIKKKDYPYHSAIFYPIKHNQDIVGALSIQTDKKDAYNTAHIELIESISPYIAIAIVNYQNSEYLQTEIDSLENDQRKLKKILQHHQKLSNIDSLTQIGNRRYMEISFQALIKKARKQQLNLSLFMIDIDDFKLYNDINGHPQGDQALIAIINQIKILFTGKDYSFTRYGGEEFLAIELNLSFKEAKNKAEKIRQSIENLAIKYNDKEQRVVTISMGLIHRKYNQITSMNKLIKDVDKCLYEAKADGKNCVIYKTIGKNNGQ